MPNFITKQGKHQVKVVKPLDYTDDEPLVTQTHYTHTQVNKEKFKKFLKRKP
jgi:hypothetical protein